jgi:hypothetical protein
LAKGRADNASNAMMNKGFIEEDQQGTEANGTGDYGNGKCIIDLVLVIVFLNIPEKSRFYPKQKKGI